MKVVGYINQMVGEYLAYFCTDCGSLVHYQLLTVHKKKCQ